MNKPTSLKTTICGVAALIGTVVIQFYPEYARHGNALVAIATGLGLIFARDNNVTSAQVEAAKIQNNPQPSQPQ
jgi:hypothetical protein